MKTWRGTVKELGPCDKCLVYPMCMTRTNVICFPLADFLESLTYKDAREYAGERFNCEMVVMFSDSRRLVFHRNIGVKAFDIRYPRKKKPCKFRVKVV